MKPDQIKFTQEALTNYKFNDDGNLEIYTVSGRHLLTLIQPIAKPNEIEAVKNELKANLRLFQHAANTFSTLGYIKDHLALLKEGTISIFDFPIGGLIADAEAALKRAGQLD